MNWKGLGAGALLATGCTHVGAAKGPDADAVGSLERIAQWEDARSLAGGELERLANEGASVPVRVRALRALARLQAPQTSGTVARRVADAEPRVREEAAFAAGSLGLSWDPLPAADRQALTAALRVAEPREVDSGARFAQLDALGRLGAPEGLLDLVARFSAEDEALAARAMLAWGVAVKRGGAVAPQAVKALQDRLAAAQTSELAYAAVYALAQTKDRAARPALVGALTHRDAEVRATAAKGLAEVGQPDDTLALGPLLADPSAPVVAEAARTLAKLAGHCKPPGCPALDVLKQLPPPSHEPPGRLQAWLAVAQQPLPSWVRPLLLRARESLQAVPEQTDDLARLDCRLGAALDRLEGTLKEVHACGGGRVPEAQRLALGLRELSTQVKGQAASRAFEALGFLHHPSPQVRAAALEVVAAAKWGDAAPKVRPLLDDADPVVSVTAAKAAGALGDATAVEPIRALLRRGVGLPDSAPALAGALVALSAKDAEPELREWLRSPHPLVRSSAAGALTALTGSPVTPPWVEATAAAPPFPPAPADAELRIHTRKGVLRVRLDTATAPRASASLWGLARKGFFNGLTFHRLVPDFVAQGGDPRGDGEGGPGYALRCELSPTRYRRGTVGMALAGKDTGGSQFFIAASAQPHLEGRYPVVGAVVEGERVLDLLLEGDVMERVEAVP